MLTRVACILITGVLVTPTFTTAPANCWGAPIIAAGAGHLPFVGEVGTGTAPPGTRHQPTLLISAAN
jgi:hypothetical protein